MPSGFGRSFRAMMPAMLGLACACAPLGTGAPRHYLAISHSSLNRVSFFDLDSRKVVGALPAQKLPHDLLLSGDQRTLYVVNTGAQCITTYHLDYEREVAELLGIPYDAVTQVALLPVAHTTGGDFRPARRRPLDDVVHWDGW